MTPLDNKVYCSDVDNHRLIVIDCTTDSVIGSVATGRWPARLCFNSVNNKVYSANEWTEDVSVIDAGADTYLTSVRAAHGDLCYNSRDNKVYVGNGPLTIVDGATDVVIQRTTRCYGVLCYNWNENKVYCAGNDSVWVIDGESNQILAAVSVPFKPVALCYNPRDNRVFCVASDELSPGHEGSVTVIDGRSDSVVVTLEVGREPTAVVCNSERNCVYVAARHPTASPVIRDSVTALSEGRPPAAPNLSLEVRPNPFSGQVRLRLTARAGTEACPYRPELRVYDVNGALVRDLHPARSLAPSLSCSLLWDGTDDLGRILPNGVYLVRVTDGSVSASRRALFMR